MKRMRLNQVREFPPNLDAPRAFRYKLWGRGRNNHLGEASH